MKGKRQKRSHVRATVPCLESHGSITVSVCEVAAACVVWYSAIEASPWEGLFGVTVRVIVEADGPATLITTVC